MKVAIMTLRYIFTTAQKYGADLEKWIEPAGLKIEDIYNPDYFVNLKQLHTLYMELFALTKNPCIGLYLGKSDLSNAGLVGLVAQNSPTVLEGVKNLVKYADISSNVAAGEMSIQKGLVNIYVRPAPVFNQLYPDSVNMVIDAHVSFIHWTIQHLSYKSITPVEINFTYPPPENITEYFHMFNTKNINFSQQDFLLIYKESDLNIETVSYNKEVLIILEEKAKAHKEEINQHKPLSYQVTKTILTYTNMREVTLEIVANTLNLTPRTLQRKLKEEDTSFKDLLNNTRKELALEMLKKKTISISEIAYTLGYAEPGVFSRMFKNWTGESPREFRQ